jgi:hypothetical protein
LPQTLERSTISGAVVCDDDNHVLSVPAPADAVLDFVADFVGAVAVYCLASHFHLQQNDH